MEQKNELLYQQLVKRKAQKTKSIAVLLDPDKFSHPSQVPYAELHAAQPDFVFVGGSGIHHSIDAFVLELKQHLHQPIVLFPGDIEQFSPHADALLLLSLISGRNPDLLIGQHVKAAHSIYQSGIETISTGYVLLQGGKLSSVEKVSHTSPLSVSDIPTLQSTTLAAQLLGMQAIYLEAGSGALNPIPPTCIQAVADLIQLPLIVGGGICSTSQIDTALCAGADVIVVGNHFEQHPADIVPFTHYVHQWKDVRHHS